MNNSLENVLWRPDLHFTRLFVSELGSRATADNVTVLRKEEGPRKEPFIRISAPSGIKQALHTGNENLAISFHRND